MKSFILSYIKKFNNLIDDVEINNEKIINLVNSIKKCNLDGGIVYILGNGGSATIANHFATDLTKNAKIKCKSFSDAGFITCYVNDYGQNNWMKEALSSYINKNDYIILISSSGESENIIRARDFCISNNIKYATLSGMHEGNRLSKNTSKENFYVNSQSYNLIEITHSLILLMTVDLLIGKSEYLATPEKYNKN